MFAWLEDKSQFHGSLAFWKHHRIPNGYIHIPIMMKENIWKKQAFAETVNTDDFDILAWWIHAHTVLDNCMWYYVFQCIMISVAYVQCTQTMHANMHECSIIMYVRTFMYSVKIWFWLPSLSFYLSHQLAIGLQLVGMIPAEGAFVSIPL